MTHSLGIVGPQPHYSPSMVPYYPNYDPQLSGFFSSIGRAFKKVGRTVKRAIPIAAPFVPGVGGVIAGMVADRITAPPPGYVGPLTPQQEAARARIAATASYNPYNPGNYPQWAGTGSNFTPFWGNPSFAPGSPYPPRTLLTAPPPTIAGSRQAPMFGLGGNMGMVAVLGGLALLLILGRR